LNPELMTAELAAEAPDEGAQQRIADLLGQAIYTALLTLMVLATVAYGGSDPSWKAFFTSAIFAVGILAVVEIILSKRPSFPWLGLLLPILSLVVFSFVQTLALSHSSAANLGIQLPVWNSISADPYETRIFALQLLALALFAALLFRYAMTERRVRFLIHLIIGIAVASAIFGLLRQTTQHEPGFGLPMLLPEQGYGQFINKNHFAYLMEMGFGLSLGLVAAGGSRRDRAPIYLGVLLPVWMALVLSNSRGGILAMLVQLVLTLLLFPVVAREGRLGAPGLWRLARAPVIRIGLVLSLVIICVMGIFWAGGDRLANSIEAAQGEFNDSPQSREGVTRTKIWQDTIDMIKANPLVGVGMGAYWTEIPRYHRGPGTMTPQQAHNDYLELAASGGIVGLALFLWFVAVVIKRTRANLQSRNSFRRAASFAALIAIAGVAVHSLVDFGLHRMLIAMIFVSLIVIATGDIEFESDLQTEDA
jgi:O-antigen ligase